MTFMGSVFFFYGKTRHWERLKKGGLMHLTTVLVLPQNSEIAIGGWGQKRDVGKSERVANSVKISAKESKKSGLIT